MTIHRIDFAIDLLGPIKHVCGAVARFAPRTAAPDGTPCPPSDVDDWSSPDRRVRVRRDRRLGRDDAGQGLRPQRLRPRVGRDQRLRRLGRLPPPRAEHDPAGQDRPRPRPGRRPRRVPQARRQPPRPPPGRARHRLPLRPRLGVRLRDRREAGRPSPASTTASTPRSSPTPSSSRTSSGPGSPRRSRPADATFFRERLARPIFIRYPSLPSRACHSLVDAIVGSRGRRELRRLPRRCDRLGDRTFGTRPSVGRARIGPSSGMRRITTGRDS